MKTCHHQLTLSNPQVRTRWTSTLNINIPLVWFYYLHTGKQNQMFTYPQIWHELLVKGLLQEMGANLLHGTLKKKKKKIKREKQDYSKLHHRIAQLIPTWHPILSPHSNSFMHAWHYWTSESKKVNLRVRTSCFPTKVNMAFLKCSWFTCPGREVGAGNYDKDLFFSLMLNYLLSRKESQLSWKTVGFPQPPSFSFTSEFWEKFTYTVFNIFPFFFYFFKYIWKVK